MESTCAAVNVPVEGLILMVMTVFSFEDSRRRRRSSDGITPPRAKYWISTSMSAAEKAV